MKDPIEIILWLSKVVFFVFDVIFAFLRPRRTYASFFKATFQAAWSPEKEQWTDFVPISDYVCYLEVWDESAVGLPADKVIKESVKTSTDLKPLLEPENELRDGLAARVVVSEDFGSSGVVEPFFEVKADNDKYLTGCMAMSSLYRSQAAPIWLRVESFEVFNTPECTALTNDGSNPKEQSSPVWARVKRNLVLQEDVKGLLSGE